MKSHKHVNLFKALEALAESVKRDNTMQALAKVYRGDNHQDDDLDKWFIQRVLLLYKPEFKKEAV